MNQILEEITRKIFALPRYGNGASIQRILYLYEEILTSDWAKRVDVIHVVGSNGKGSTSLMLAALFNELGFQTGCYTSPHLFEINERISFNQALIAPSKMAEYWMYFERKKERYHQQFPKDTIGFFEILTGIALMHFYKQNAEVIVLEAGIGGRFDETRIMQGKWTALTSVDLEHTQLLGNSLIEIACDKIEIAAAHTTVVTGITESEVLRRLKAYAILKNIHLLPIVERVKMTLSAAEEDKMYVDITVDGWAIQQLKSHIVGFHQMNNIAVALLTLKNWLRDKALDISYSVWKQAVYQAFEKLSLKGRFEKIHSTPPTWVDVAHTPAALKALATWLQQTHQKPILLVFGVSEGRNIEASIQAVLPLADAVVCTQAYHKGAATEKVYDVLQQTEHSIPIMKSPVLEEALDFAMQYAASKEMHVFITGSLFMAIEAKNYLKGHDPQLLSFVN